MCQGPGLVEKQLMCPPTPTHVHRCIFQELKSLDFKSLPVAPNISVILSVQECGCYSYPSCKDAGEDPV